MEATNHTDSVVLCVTRWRSQQRGGLPLHRSDRSYSLFVLEDNVKRVDLRGETLVEFVGDAGHDTSTVTSLFIARAGSTVLHAIEHRVGLLDDLYRKKKIGLI